MNLQYFVTAYGNRAEVTRDEFYESLDDMEDNEGAEVDFEIVGSIKE